MQAQAIQLKFTGKGGEYFRIWIVNLLLTILTLGIYSAWAKVRRMQYFHRNTWLQDANFDYHGTPIAILKGRLIAFALFAGYNIMFNISPLIGMVILLLIILIMPWLLVKSFRFRLYNTSYRGLRFGFTGTYGGSYINFLLLPIASMFTLYLLAPFAHHQIKLYQHGNSRFGQTPFTFNNCMGGFYKVYLFTFLLLLGMFAMLGFLAFFIVQQVNMPGMENNKTQLIIGIAIGYILFLFGFLMIVPYFTSRIQNLIWNNTRLQEHEFRSNLGAFRLFWISISNIIAVIFTLGLFKPFADIRMTKYRLEQMSMLPASDMETFLAASKQEDGAMGSETAEMFDIDIAM